MFPNPHGAIGAHPLLSGVAKAPGNRGLPFATASAFDSRWVSRTLHRKLSAPCSLISTALASWNVFGTSATRKKTLGWNAHSSHASPRTYQVFALGRTFVRHEAHLVEPHQEQRDECISHNLFLPFWDFMPTMTGYDADDKDLRKQVELGRFIPPAVANYG